MIRATNSSEVITTNLRVFITTSIPLRKMSYTTLDLQIMQYSSHEPVKGFIDDQVFTILFILAEELGDNTLVQ
jgi:hypothetical protein